MFVLAGPLGEIVVLGFSPIFSIDLDFNCKNFLLVSDSLPALELKVLIILKMM